MRIVVNGTAKGCTESAERDAFEARVALDVPDAVVSFTTPNESVQDLVRRLVHDGATTVVAGGGDGTVNAVASVLAGTDVVMGVLALGTLNHFAKDIGVPLEIDDALAVLTEGNVVRVDVGKVNDCVFVNNSGLGLYPEMVYRRERQQQRGVSKWWAAFVESVRVLRRYKTLSLTLDINGQRLMRTSPAVFVGNNEYDFSATRVSQREHLNGGTLALYMPHTSTPLKLVWTCIRALLGVPRHKLELETFVTTGFALSVNVAQPRVSIDGEVETMTAPIRYESWPGALQVLVPRNTANSAAA